MGNAWKYKPESELTPQERWAKLCVQERTRMRKTRKEWAEMLNVSVHTLSYWENGHVLPKADKLSRFAEVTNTPTASVWAYVEQAEGNRENSIVEIVKAARTLDNQSLTELIKLLTDLLYQQTELHNV